MKHASAVFLLSGFALATSVLSPCLWAAEPAAPATKKPSTSERVETTMPSAASKVSATKTPDNASPTEASPFPSPRRDLVLKIFGAEQATACQRLRTEIRRPLEDFDASLGEKFQKLVKGLNERKNPSLLELFHPRSRLNDSKIGDTIAYSSLIFGDGWRVSLLAAYALASGDGSAAQATCADDGFVFSPIATYPFQVVTLLQISGSVDLGQATVVWVPHSQDGRWLIAAYHTDRLTQGGRNAEAWEKLGSEAEQAGDKIRAYIMFDMAAKLSTGNPTMSLSRRAVYEAARDKMMTLEAFRSEVLRPLAGLEPAYVATALVIGGSGLIVRLRVPGEKSLSDVRTLCASLRDRVAATPWGRHLDGVQCDLLMPTEPVEKAGRLGGLFMDLHEKGVPAAR